MDAVAPFSFNPATSFSDSLTSMFNPLALLNGKYDETLSKAWMPQAAMESGLDVSPVLASRSISGDAPKNPLSQFIPLQLAPPVLPPQLSAYMSATAAQSGSAFGGLAYPLAPNALSRSCSLEYPAQPSAGEIPAPCALTLSPSSSVDTSAVNSPTPALLSTAASVAESESDEEEFKVKCERQIEADRQHNILSARAVASQLGVPTDAMASEEKVRRGRRRKGDTQNDESQERRRRRRLDSHMRYDRHRREVLQGIFTDLRSLVYSANEIAESSNQTLQACKPVVKSENGASGSASSVSGVHESMDCSIFLRNFSREDLEKLSVCDLLSVTHRCLRSLNQLKSKLENRIQQMETETEKENETEKDMAMAMAKDMEHIKTEDGGNISSPAVAVDTQAADPVLSSLFYYPIGFSMYTRVD